MLFWMMLFQIIVALAWSAICFLAGRISATQTINHRLTAIIAGAKSKRPAADGSGMVH